MQPCLVPPSDFKPIIRINTSLPCGKTRRTESPLNKLYEITPIVNDGLVYWGATHSSSEQVSNWTFSSDSRVFSPQPELDIARMTSSTLQKIDKHPPRLDIHKHPPPLGHCLCDIMNIPRGSDRSQSRTLCIGFQDQDKFKGR